MERNLSIILKADFSNYHSPDRSIQPNENRFCRQPNNDMSCPFDGLLNRVSAIINPAEYNKFNAVISSFLRRLSPVVVTKPGLGASYLHGWSPTILKCYLPDSEMDVDIYSVDVKNRPGKAIDQPEDTWWMVQNIALNGKHHFLLIRYERQNETLGEWIQMEESKLNWPLMKYIWLVSTC